MEAIADRGFAQIKSIYPQANIERGRHHDLVVVPGFKLCKGWKTPCHIQHEYPNAGIKMEPATICTVLFHKPAGFPAAKPDHFWTDIRLRLDNLMMPQCSNEGNEVYGGFDQWKGTQWFSWHLQMWDPNRDTLFTFVNAIRHRLNPAR